MLSELSSLVDKKQTNEKNLRWYGQKKEPGTAICRGKKNAEDDFVD